MSAADKRIRREEKWKAIIVHHTGLDKRSLQGLPPTWWQKHFENIKDWLTKKDNNYLSAHYLIGRDGKTDMLVDPKTHEAFHCGKSFYGGLKDLNRYAIGIELLGSGDWLEYTEKQYTALNVLIRDLWLKYPEINKDLVLGHSQINQNKVDPGKLFLWQKLKTLLERPTIQGCHKL